MLNKNRKLIIILILVASLLLSIYMLLQRPKPKNNSETFSPLAKYSTFKGILNSLGIAQPDTYTIKLDETEDLRALGYSGQRKLAVDSKGAIYAVYRKKAEGTFEIFITKVTPDYSTISNSKIETYEISKVRNEVNQRVPSIFIDAKDKIYVVWYGANSTEEENNRQIKYAESSDYGKTWSKWKDISIVEDYDNEDLWQEHPDIAVSENGDIYVVWEGKDKNHENQQIKFSKSTDNGMTWAEWKNVRPTPDNTQSRPSVVIDKTGTLHLLMYSGNNGPIQQIWHTTSKDKGETWTEWVNVSKSAFDSRHLSVVKDPVTDDLWVTFRAKTTNNGPTKILLSKLEGGRWSTPTVVKESNSYQFFPTIGFNNSGIGLVSWMESPDESGYPRENPEGENKLKISTFAKGLKTDKSIENISIEGNQLYPNVASVIKNSDFFTVLYLKQIKEDKYEINLSFIR